MGDLFQYTQKKHVNRFEILMEPNFKHKSMLLANHNSILNDIFHYAGAQDFISNLITYARYFITVMLGTTYMMVRPITTLFNERMTAVLAICGMFGLAYFIYLTLYSMLGLLDVF